MTRNLAAREVDRQEGRPHDASVTAILERLDGRSVVLVGLMGAGKTTIGRRLAALLGLTFVDADVEIERAAGCRKARSRSASTRVHSL